MARIGAVEVTACVTTRCRDFASIALFFGGLSIPTPKAFRGDRGREKCFSGVVLMARIGAVEVTACVTTRCRDFASIAHKKSAATMLAHRDRLVYKDMKTK